MLPTAAAGWSGRTNASSCPSQVRRPRARVLAAVEFATGALPRAPRQRWSSARLSHAQTSPRPGGAPRRGGRGIRPSDPRPRARCSPRAGCDPADARRSTNGTLPTPVTSTPRCFAAIVPRFSPSVTNETLKNLGELYDSLRERGVYVHSHPTEINWPGTVRSTSRGQAYQVDPTWTRDGKFLPDRRSGGKSLLAGAPPRAPCPLRGRRAGALGRDGDVDIALPDLAAVSVPAPCRGSGPSRRG